MRFVRTSRLALWVVFLGGLAGAWAVGVGEGSWKTLAPGVSWLQTQSPDPRATLVRFSLAQFSFDVVVTPVSQPLTAAAVRNQMDAAAVVNGGFFDTDGKPMGLRVSQGRVLLPVRRRVDWGVLLISRARARIVHSREVGAEEEAGFAGIEAAIQVGPRLVVGGKALRLKPQVSLRTAVALDAEGRTVTLLVTQTPTSAQALADALVRLGFHEALLLDGGPSTQFAARVGEWQQEQPGGYAVPDLLVVKRL